MKRYAVALLLSLSCCITALAAPDYTQYHKDINEAERQLFVLHDIKAGLQIYSKVFKQYDFVFLFDCVVALQMALYANDTASFLEFTGKGMKSGLMPRHLMKIQFINAHPLYNRYKDSAIAMYRMHRPLYLKRIDTSALKTLYELRGNDQVEKSHRKNESQGAYMRRYKPQIATSMKRLKELIDKKGFSSEKLIGVDQNDLMLELGLNAPEMISYYHQYKDESTIDIEQFTFDEKIFSSSLIWALWYHYARMFKDYDFYPEPFYLEQIKLGNIHPKEVKAFCDEPYSMNDGVGANHGIMFTVLKAWEQEGYHPPRQTAVEVLNRNREKYSLPPVEQEDARDAFLKEKGMATGYKWE